MNNTITSRNSNSVPRSIDKEIVGNITIARSTIVSRAPLTNPLMPTQIASDRILSKTNILARKIPGVLSKTTMAMGHTITTAMQTAMMSRISGMELLFISASTLFRHCAALHSGFCFMQDKPHLYLIYTNKTTSVAKCSHKFDLIYLILCGEGDEVNEVGFMGDIMATEVVSFL